MILNFVIIVLMCYKLLFASFIHIYSKTLVDKCDCPQDWRYKYMKYLSLILIILTLVVIVLNVAGTILNKSISQAGGSINPIVFKILGGIIGIGLIFLPSVLWYYSIISTRNELIDTNCECETKYRDITYIMCIIDIIVTIVILVLSNYKKRTIVNINKQVPNRIPIARKR
jgi:hypothetical protein